MKRDELISVSSTPAVATLLGDVVSSRTSADRADLHRRLEKALHEVSESCGPTVPLRVTVGDEYQGVFATVGAAVAASLHLRLALTGEAEVRHGIGWGPIEVLDAQPRVEDGPGWWSAREAIDRVRSEEEVAARRSVRTAYVRHAEASEGPDPCAVNAALLLRDQMLGAVSPRSLSVLDDLLRGRTQREIAEREGVSPSAVSQRVRADGLGMLMAAHEMLTEVR